eukprot:5049576-Lingulodinium_polyedra.AAC.1
MEDASTFYSQFFWCNNEIVAVHQDCLAKAKHGENVVRCTIGRSPGGVGQSIYTSFLAAQL